MATKLNIKPGGTTGKLKINQSVEYGTLDWDGSVYINYNPKGIIDPSNNKTIKFKMILDATSGFIHNGIFTFRNINDWTDSFEAELHGDLFGVDTGSAGDNQSFLLSDFPYSEVFDVEITKSFQTIDFFKVNGIELSDQGSLSTSSSNVTAIGYCGSEERQLEDAAIWDFEIYDGATLLHKMKGYPAGNTFEAWKDIVGNASTGSITEEGLNPPQLRYIEGTEGDIFNINKKLLLQGTFVEQPILSFVTNASTNAFHPTIAASGTAQWDLGDGSIINSNAVNHTYASDGNKTVDLYLGTISSIDNITTLDFYDNDVGGELDLREFTYLTTANFRTNENLTSVIPATSSNVEISQFRVDDCSIAGSLDLSVYTGMKGQLYTNNNTNLTSITLPDSSGTFNYIGLGACGFSSLDFTPLTGAIAGININNNANLTSVLFPEDSSSQLGLYVSGLSSFTGTLDVSSLKGLHQFLCQNNFVMTGITMPEVINDMGLINVFRAGLEGTWDLSMLGTHFPESTVGNLCPSLNGLIIPAASKVITRFDFSNCDLTGTLDVSGLTGLGGDFTIHSNDNLTKILNPTSSQTFIYYRVHSCDLTGTLDVSGLTGLGGAFYAGANSNLTGLKLPTSSETFNTFNIVDSDIQGILDVSSLTGLGGNFYTSYNENMTGVLFPTSSTNFTSISMGDCSITGTLDVSGLSGLGGKFFVYNNEDLTNVIFPSSVTREISQFGIGNCNFTSLDISMFNGGWRYNFSCASNLNLQTITLPTITGEFLQFLAGDCSLNTTTVDTIFSDMNTWYLSNSPTSSLRIDTDGGGSSPPTDGALNLDISSLTYIFDTAGETLTININT